MKILIWSKGIELKNCGGPSGYLYNIYDYLLKHPCDNIDFYPLENKYDILIHSKGSIKETIHKLLKKCFGHPFHFILSLRNNYFRHTPLSNNEIELIDQYDYVHIHYLSHYLQSFMGFNNGHTKFILTTHNPEPLIDQIAGENKSEWFLKLFGFRDYFIKREISAYEAADYIMFPVEQSREPYMNRSNLYRRAFDFFEKKKKFFYVPTCLNTTDKIERNDHILDKYNIPEDSLKVCYVGRHSEIKGYDTIQKLAKLIWISNKNVYFIIGGKEGPIKGLRHPNWIELGWVNTQSLLNEVDCFILPNKDTYFDLVLLEVIRQGTPTLLTKTGGNKWFENKTEGLFFYDREDILAAKDIILNLADYKKNGVLLRLMKLNMKFYKDTFDMKYYIKRYISNIKQLSLEGN